MDAGVRRAGMLAVVLGVLGLTCAAAGAASLRAAEQTPLSAVGPHQPAEPADDELPDDDHATALADGRYTVATRRGGTLDLGVATARALHLTSGPEAADFILAADVRFDRGSGPAAATVRFRYRPEAGGGTGYLLSVDPFAAQVRLVAFDEGHQDVLTPWTAHVAAALGSGSTHLVLEASGPMIAVSLDGQEVLRTVDARFANGLIAVGAVTWADPVTVTFDNVVVTVPGAWHSGGLGVQWRTGGPRRAGKTTNGGRDATEGLHGTHPGGRPDLRADRDA